MQGIHSNLAAHLLVSDAAVQHAHSTDSAGNYALTLDERSLITQAAFVHAFIALEEFLEASAIHYLQGGVGLNGWAVVSYVDPRDGDHAMEMLIGQSRFVDWSSPDVVRKLSRVFLANGEPFESALAGFHSDLLDMKTVRNACSHVSRSTGTALGGFLSRWTGVPSLGVSAYDALLAVGKPSGQSYYQHARATISRIGQQISSP